MGHRFRLSRSDMPRGWRMDGIHAMGMEDLEEEGDEDGNNKLGVRGGNICALAAGHQHVEEITCRFCNGFFRMV
jgi:hypothetical protein